MNKYTKTSKLKKILIGLGIATASAGAVFVSQQEKEIVNPTPIEIAQPASISFNGQEITFIYTDENAGENVGIYTDKETYGEFSDETVYTAITNYTTSQNFQIQVHTGENEELVAIEEFKPQVPYEVDVEDYAKQDTCEYSEFTKKDECFKKQIGSHKETRYVDQFNPMVKKVVENLSAKDSKKRAQFTAKGQVEYWVDQGETKYFKFTLKHEAAALKSVSGEFDIKVFGSDNGYGSLDPWYGTSGWLYRMPITIDYTKIGSSTPVSNFPVLFNTGTTSPPTELKFTGSGGHVASSTGADILFTLSDGTTKLDHELEKYASSTGETVAWVRFPNTLSTSTNTTLYIYYGNAAASNQQNVTGTWPSSYDAVWHFPNGTTLTANDSTSNANNATSLNSTAATEAQIDGGASMNGSSNYININHNANLGIVAGASKTISVWYKSGMANGAGGWIFGKRNGNEILGIRAQGTTGGTTNAIEFYGRNSAASGINGGYIGTSFSNIWHHLVFTYDTNNGSFISYFDGSQLSTATAIPAGNIASGGAALTIGQLQGSEFFKDLTDELRIADGIFSASWIRTEYNNQNSPSTFYSLGAEENEPVISNVIPVGYINMIGGTGEVVNITGGVGEVVNMIGGN